MRGSFFAAGVTDGHDRQQLHRRAARPRPDHAGRDAQGVGLQPRRRRADRAGPALVLRHVPRRRQRAHGARACSPTPTPAIPTKWTYVADTSRPAVVAASYRIMALRLTAQVTPRNKVTVFWDEQMPVRGRRRGRLLRQRLPHVGATISSTPDRRPRRRRRHRRRSRRKPPRIATTAIASYQAKWTAPVTNRLLLEAGLRHVSQPLRRQEDSRPRRRESDSRRRAVRGRLRRQRQHSRT